LKETAIITDIKAGKNPRVQRSNLFLDGKFAFSLENELVLKEHLKVGAELSADQIERLGGADNKQRCLNSGLRFLAYRPRSEAETRERLKKKGFAEGEIEKSIEHLKRLDLLNDAAFARYWKENRDSFKPRGQRLLKAELRQKGLAAPVIEAAVETTDEEEGAYRAAARKAVSLSALEFPEFRRRLGSFLQRRGFDFAVSNRAVKRLWEERTAAADEGEAARKNQK